MEKTMFDFWSEQATQASEFIAKIREYSDFEMHIENAKSCSPIFTVSETEAERLKSIPYPQPPINPEKSDLKGELSGYWNGDKPLYTTKNADLEKEFSEQDIRHRQNIEILTLEHQQRTALEEGRNRTAFDKKSTEAMQAIFSMGKDLKDAGISETDIQKNKRYAAIYWCHQQAALLPTNTYAWQVDNSQNVLKSIDITANYLFKTFFPDLQ